MWSWSDPGGHIARVSAIGPNSSRFGPGELHDPRPRLQSMRAATTPSVPKAIVYFALSSGTSALSSPPWNLTSCQEVPPRPAAGSCGGIRAQDDISSTSASNRHAAALPRPLLDGIERFSSDHVHRDGEPVARRGRRDLRALGTAARREIAALLEYEARHAGDLGL